MSIIDELAKRVYLGDGVYAHHDGYQVWLTTSGVVDHAGWSFARGRQSGPIVIDGIALDSGVMQALKDYDRDMRKRIRDHESGEREKSKLYRTDP
jgi:hypothetical protein